MDSREMKDMYEQLRVGGTYPLSGKDIMSVMEHLRVKIVDLRSLPKNPPQYELDNLLKNNAVVLFIPHRNANIGHWTALLYYNNTIEFFDSYGNDIPDDDVAKPLKEMIKYRNKNIRYVHNTFKFQKKGGDILTCGYHVIWRIYCLIIFKMTLEQYIKFMYSLKDYDRAVVWFVGRLASIIDQ